MSLAIRTPGQVDQLAANLNRFMQTIRARAQRIDQIRRSLATLTEPERISIACELLGVDEDELFATLEAGVQAMKETPQ